MRYEMRVDPYNMRNLCIQQRYYTRGNTEEYAELLNMCSDDDNSYTTLTDDLLTALVENIFTHSDFDDLIEMGYTDDDLRQDIAFYILNKCATARVYLD